MHQQCDTEAFHKQAIDMLLEMCSHGVNGQQIVLVVGSLHFTTDSGDVLDLVINEPLSTSLVEIDTNNGHDKDNISEVFSDGPDSREIKCCAMKNESAAAISVSSSERTFICSYCGKLFKSQHGHKLHEFSHCRKLSLSQIEHDSNAVKPKFKLQSDDSQSTANQLTELPVNHHEVIAYSDKISRKSVQSDSIYKYCCCYCAKMFKSRRGHELHERSHRNKNDRLQVADSSVAPEATPDSDSLFLSARKNHCNNLSMDTNNKIVKSNRKSKQPVGRNRSSLYLLKKQLRAARIPRSSENEYRCRYCDKVLKSRSGLDLHELYHINISCRTSAPNNLVASMESSKFRPGTNIFDNTSVSDNIDTSAEGVDCHSQFVEESNRKGSMPSSTPFLCIKCSGETFSSVQHLMAHNYRHHVTVTCQRCGLRFSGRLAFQEHVRVEHPTIPVYKVNMKTVCEFCSERCSNHDELQLHINTVHQGQLLQCEHCDKLVLNAKHLKVHIRDKHRPDQWQTCEGCGAQFPRFYTLIRHLRTAHPHLLPEKYRFDIKCSICNMTFSCKSLLTSHVRENHDPANSGSQLECMCCRRVFACERYLRRHLKLSKSCGHVKREESSNCVFAPNHKLMQMELY